MIDDMNNSPETEPITPEIDDFAASIVGGFTGTPEPSQGGSDALADATAVVDVDGQYRFWPDTMAFDEPVPGPKEPDKVARLILYVFADAGLHLKHWRDEWYLYREGASNGAHVRLGGADNRYAVADAVRNLLADAQYFVTTKDGPEPRPWSPTTSSVREVVEAMASQMRLPESFDAPMWLRKSTPEAQAMISEEIACVSNGLLWCPRAGGKDARQLVGHTPEFFTDVAVAVPYQADARCDRWMKFLDELWPGDEDSQALLQEWFGYVLAGSTGLHKMLTLVGPPRSGKSTIAWVLEALLGGGSQVDHPTMARLAEPFGLAPMLGKRLAVVGDARIGKSDTAIVEKLLMISGEDPVTVNRKNRDELSVKMNARIMIVSNSMPDLRDGTGALASRFLPLSIKIDGFLGREDFSLKRTLADELPGILAWALDGADRLWDREGRFTIGKAVQANMEEVKRFASPVMAFAQDCLVFETGAYELKDRVHETYELWCADAGYHARGKNVFFRELSSAYPGKVEGRRVRIDGAQKQTLWGARLR